MELGGVHCHAAPRAIRVLDKRGFVMTEQERRGADASGRVPEPRDSDEDTTTDEGGRVAVRVGLARLHHDPERLPHRAERFLGLLDRSRRGLRPT
jgi:hypothetical protein